VPAWARATLRAHASDPRRPAYTRAALERAATADPYWNAAMREMRYTGYLHNQMRMYWGKKILEWTRDPETAYETALALNNRYLLDGRDPASYANVAWVFGLHDRPWPERAIYGTVRSMTASGLRRKSDIDAYVGARGRCVAAARRHGVRFDDDGG
jgi:deoxyribodipyrimidine photo-lyase